MLQFIINGNNACDIIEIATNALNNGCRWIRLDLKDIKSSELESTIKAIQEKCDNNEAFLTLEIDVDTALSMKVAGVHLNADCDISDVDARKKLGEEPILGVTVNNATDIPYLPRTAIDYVAVNSDNLDLCRQVAEQMKAIGLDEPLVAPYSQATSLTTLMETGINGIAVRHDIIPTTKLPKLLDELNKIVEHRLKNL